MLACTIKCSCGGTVCQTTEDGVWYYTTEDNDIIFRGICSDCENVVSVIRSIASLFFLNNEEAKGKVM